MSWPILFINLGQSKHLPYCAISAKLHNPESPVYIISDQELGVDIPNSVVSRLDLADFQTGAGEFRKVYKHLSVNEKWYESLCFERWFILRDFLKVTGNKQALMLDSDVMLFSNAEKEAREMGEFEFTLSMGCCPHCCFMNSASALDQICEYFLFFYSEANRDFFEECKARYETGPERGEIYNLCDMVLLSQIAARKKLKIFETANIWS